MTVHRIRPGREDTRQDVIRFQDDYDLAQAKAGIAVAVSTACIFVSHLVDYLDNTWEELTHG